MFKKASFRRKIFLSQLVLFLCFLAVLFPFAQKTSNSVVVNSLRENAQDLIDAIKDAPNEKEMIELLKAKEYYVSFRVGLLNDKGEILYDSYLTKSLKEQFVEYHFKENPEVTEALRSGQGYNVARSQIFPGLYAYFAKSFQSHGQTYVLRTAIPLSQIQDLTENFMYGFLLILFVILLIFTFSTWLIFYRLTRPIKEIIQAIKPYRGGRSESLPEITLSKSLRETQEFMLLAETLNSLSEHIRQEIKNLTEERNEKEAILESLGEGVIAVDSQLNVKYINFIGSKMLGIPKRYLLDKPLPRSPDRLASALIEKCRELLVSSQESMSIVTDSIAMGDSRKIYLDLIAAPKSHRKGAIIVLQDKSSNYKVLEMGKDFVANASHELRTPITIIKGFAETLQDIPEMPREMLVDITEKIVRNCQRMENLVKNLLTLADIEHLPKSRFQECDLISLIENCVHLLLSKYSHAHMEIHKNKESILVPADPDLLELAILNLLDNAAKYSPANAEIAVAVEDLGKEVKVSFIDKGIGIPETDLEHIFERFYTVNKAHSRRLGGAGLGLSIVKTIIEKHEGTISAESILGKGTTFTIILPTCSQGESEYS